MKFNPVFLLIILLLFFISHAFPYDSLYTNAGEAIITTSNNENIQPVNITVTFGEFSINTSNVNVEAGTYNNFELMPEFNIWKFSLGLDLDFYYDVNGNFIITEWNSWQALVTKINYFKIGSKDDLFYLKVGYIDDFTLGDGFIVNQYSDMLNYPDIKIKGITCGHEFSLHRS